MQPIILAPAPHRQPAPNPLEKYYAFHARIYNATRWSFLFGRTHLLELARQLQPNPTRILEIGCGTGRNLARLARFFPQAQIIGVDLSTTMLAVARRQTARYRSQITLIEDTYGNARSPVGHYDLVICSTLASKMRSPRPTLTWPRAAISYSSIFIRPLGLGSPAGCALITSEWTASSDRCSSLRLHP